MAFSEGKSRCKSCGAEIVWMKTSAGKNIPVDVGSVEKDALGMPEVFNPDTMQSHFVTCPDRDKWRKK